MRRHVLLLAAAVILSGCTAFPSGQTGIQERGVEVSASLTDDTLFADDSTQLVLEVRNHNPNPLTGLEVRLGNVNDLDVEGQGCPLMEDGGATVEASGFGVPAIEQCVWEVSAAEGFSFPAQSDEARIPLTVFVTYTTELAPRADSVKVDFRSLDDISPGETTTQRVQAGNGDLSLSASHEGPVSVESGNVPLEISVSNAGGGRILSLQEPVETSEVEIYYGGSFAGIGGGVPGGMDQDTTCLDGGSAAGPQVLLERKTLAFLEGRRTASLECQFSLLDDTLSTASLEGRTFTLRPSVKYRYRVTRETPLTLVRRD